MCFFLTPLTLLWEMSFITAPSHVVNTDYEITKQGILICRRKTLLVCEQTTVLKEQNLSF